MDMSDTDPYEQQLRALFESFDSNNLGSLDRKGLQQLCEQLPLDQNQSADLINAILLDTSSRISFVQFWEALLNLLGGGWGSPCVQASSPEKVQEKEAAAERGASPEREVSPKLVLGQKKYGRRSRPESSELEFDANTSEDDPIILQGTSEEKAKPDMSCVDDEGNDEDQHSCFNAKKRRTAENQSNHLREPSSTSFHSFNSLGSQGSYSQAEDCLKQAWQQYGKNGYVNQTELAQVCECIGNEKLSSEAMQQLFEQLDTDGDGKVSLEDFLMLIRSGAPSTSVPASAIQGSWVLGANANSLSGGASLSLTEFNGVGTASTDAIIELWENVGVTSPAILLHDLNLDDPSRPLNVAFVACALEEEIARLGKTSSVSESSALPDSSGPSLYVSNLLLAALTLRQAEVRWMKSSVEQMSCERDKLRNDLAEANCRASLLAQEIDDHHSKLEKVSQNQFKLMEQKHSEAIKDLMERFSQEREQLTQHNNRLEQKVTFLQQSESKLVSEVASLRLENESLDQESRNLAERVAECEEAKLQMSKELQEIENLQQRLTELQANQEQDRIEHLYEQISKLRAENSSLRDRNDELTVELEVLTTRLSNMRVRRQGPSCVDGGLKRRGNSSLGVEPTDESGDEESPRVGKVRRCSQKGEISLDNVHIEGLQIHPLGTSESGVEADIDVDSTENLSVGSICKLSGNKALLESEQWLNIASESSSLLGSQDDLMNMHTCNLRNASKRNIDVARLQARIEELERALTLHSSNFVGSHNVNQEDVLDLNEVEVESFDLSEKDTPSSSCPQQRYFVSGVEDVTQAESSQTVNSEAVEQLQQHCKGLEIELENVKSQIVKILSEKRACSEENCELKKKLSDLQNQLPNCGSTLDKHASLSMSHDDQSNFIHNVILIKEHDSSSSYQSSQKQDEGTGTSDNPNTMLDNRTFEKKLKTIEAAHATELSALRDQCSDLEKSLAMMRDEYERCEDYWAGKLDEERQLAEQEQRITDEKFSELMSKIREYEDLFADDHMRRASKPLNGRLETIEEQDGLEKQVMELEDEIEDVRSQAEAKLAEKESEIGELKEQLHQLQQYQRPSSVCSADRAVQVSDLETRSWESDRTFIVKPRIALNEERPSLQALNGNVTENVFSSTLSTSSSGGSSGLCGEGDIRDTPHGAVRHHQAHGRHRRIRHHPHYAALNCLNPEDELQAVGLRLHEQEQTCVRLQRALRAQQQQTQALLQHSWDRHKQELTDLQVILQCTQEKMKQQGEICRDQLNRLTHSDILIKELYVENAHLLASIQNLEERCLLMFQQQTSISSVENCSSV